MELVKDYKTLIETLVKSNPKYTGNEDLIEDFCSETYQKSYLILQSVSDENALKTYLKKVVSSAIIDVLKNSGRITRSTQGYRSVNKVSISENNTNENELTIDEIELNNIETDEQTVEIYDNNNRHLQVNIPPVISNDLENIKDPKESIEDQIIRKDIIENIIELVKQINAEQPQEKYPEIFYKRYFLHKKQKDIANETGLSQSEVSKRLVKLSQLIKEKLY